MPVLSNMHPLGYQCKESESDWNDDNEEPHQQKVVQISIDHLEEGSWYLPEAIIVKKMPHISILPNSPVP